MFDVYSYSIRTNFLITLFISLCSFLPVSHAFDKNTPLIAATLEYPPYEYSENGKAKGIAVEIIREVARRTGVKHVQFNFYPWKRAVYSAKVGDSHLLFNAGKNEERQLWGRYSDSVLILQKYVLFKRATSTIEVDNTFDNVSDVAIAIRMGYLYGTGPFRQAVDSEKFASVTLSKSTQQSVNMLLGDRIDLFIGDYLPVMHYIKKHHLENQIDVIKRKEAPTQNLIVLTWPTYLLFSKKNVDVHFVSEVKETLDQMKDDGFVDEVFQRYMY
ncbi:transporter substrate-binding domain-containing protein [Vibrio sp. Of7-15]|uniref:substrate-binding periplasmic protein n=1 Tax=Vibrio sp. Of7-15 TaxID=2724879 RepID=UPI001EF349D9|nr:transporter substrate-binding domain-containing protein [Vibrio sp. Of7-15]MCG7498816.1 transporter substrate-binding domain-containing protein [Vibrio sp. Of7-15]